MIQWQPELATAAGFTVQQAAFAEARAEGSTISEAANRAAIPLAEAYRFDADEGVRGLIDDFMRERRYAIVALAGNRIREMLEADELEPKQVLELYKSGFRDGVSRATPKQNDIGAILRIVAEAVGARMGLLPEDTAAVVAEAERIISGAPMPAPVRYIPVDKGVWET